jgi:hypothetical protein
MPLIATPARRRAAMATLLTLAALGGVMRWLAPNPSITRDIGTLMLVLWLPAIGNLIAWLTKKLPRSAPPPTHFSPEAPFSAQVEAQLQRLALPAGFATSIEPGQLATVLVGRRGFTVRLAEPIAQWLAGEGDSPVMLELLRPSAATAHLVAGTDFHLLVGRQPVAKGVVRAFSAPPAR